MTKEASGVFFDYITQAYSKMMMVDQEKVNQAYDLLLNNMSNVVIFGNGGSAAIADHFCCDFLKGIQSDTNLRPKCISLASNGPLVSALSNDYSYSTIFSKQIYYHEPSLAIAVSSSGNSDNIVNGLITARANGVKTLALVGFDGGRVLRDNLADVIVHIDCNNYGIVEDAHMMVLHALVQKIRTDFAFDPKRLKL